MDSKTDGSSDEPRTLQDFIPRLQQDALRRRHESRLVFSNFEEDVVKVVELIFRTQRTVAGVRETHAQSFVLIRNVVHVPLGPCHRVRTNSAHIEEGERAETVSEQTGHQRDGVQALSLYSQFSRRGSLARKVQT